MDASLSRGYAGQLIDRMPSDPEFKVVTQNGMTDKVYDQFYQVCYTKKVDTIARKMRRACGGRMRVRIPSWTRNRTTVVLDCVTGNPDLPAHSHFNHEHVRWSEKSLVMHTIFCERQNEDFRMYRMEGPSMGQHAVSRLLNRKAATVETLRATCHAALSRAREAVALLRQEEDVYDLLLPFADGAIAVQVHGSRAPAQPGELPPNLSVRTYLTEDMFNEERSSRVIDLQNFYLQQAWSDTDRYRELLLENRRFLGLAQVRSNRLQEQALPV